MLFNSIEYIIFLPVVYLLYWMIFTRSIRLRNLFLLVVSYVFYGWWDWRFLGLIILSSFVDYFAGLAISQSQTQSSRKRALSVSLAVNLGLLGVFKYFNFFALSLSQALGPFGVSLDWVTINVVLPVGISFYTFQTLSYTIDIYRGNLEPTRDVVAFFAFVSFFPQLVAGPIERASQLLPQFNKINPFDTMEAKDGLRQILWGLFKKIVVADNAARFANRVFDSADAWPASVLVLGVVLFAVQIYCDFSGYSDIAIGTARLFGFSLMRNFAYPYFSRNIAEFWQRWHISLSTWFRDYVYIPLGGSRNRLVVTIRNVLIVFTVSGLWHGANTTFITWGALNGLYFIPLMVMGNNKKYSRTSDTHAVPAMKDGLKILLTFVLTCFAWIFFRADSMQEAISYISRIFSMSLLSSIWVIGDAKELLATIGVIIVMFSVEWIQRTREHGLSFRSTPVPIRWAAYVSVAIAIVIFGNFSKPEFIYFQF